MMVSQAYTISTVKNAVPPRVKMSQYDSASRTITFTVVDASGATVDLTGKTATVEGTRIDGHAFVAACTVSGSTVSFTETVDMTNTAGDHPAELVIRQSGQRLGTMNFILSVEAAAMDENASIIPEDESLFNQLYGSVDDAIAEVDGAKDDALQEIAQGLASGSPLVANTVAEMTDTDEVYLYTGSESGYTAGSWYYYNGSAWVVGGVYGSGTTDATLSLAGVAADAKATGDAVEKINTSVENLDENVFESKTRISVPSSNISSSYYLDGTGKCLRQTGYKLLKYEVTAGSLIWIKASADSAGVYQFQKSKSVPSTLPNSNLIGSPITHAEDGLVLVPQDATWIIISAYSDNAETGLYVYGTKYSDISNLREEMGLYFTTFTMAAGSAHSSNNDQISIQIKEGEQFSLMSVTDPVDSFNVQWFLLATDGTSTRKDARSNTTIVCEAPKDLRGIAAYIGAQSAAHTITIELRKNVSYRATEAVSGLNALMQTFNSSYHAGATDFESRCQDFSALMYGDTMNAVTAPSDFESFLFFTDPHLMPGTGWEEKCYEFIAQIQKYYNSTPTTFCLCGGDWLSDSDTPAEACFKMGYIDGFMHSMFNDCYLLLGNHDTNYQGKKDEESETYTTRLSEQSLIDLWYRKEKKAYYSFDGANTRFYCFDTGTEGQALTAYDNYGLRQAEWFANALLTDDSEHIAVALHILYNTISGKVVHPLTEQILAIAEAYNARTSITFNSTTYNYSSRSGKVEFGIFGHTHEDYDVVIHGIPCLITTWVRESSDAPTFDLVFADYTNSTLKTIRVGSGSDRAISLT